MRKNPLKYVLFFIPVTLLFFCLTSCQFSAKNQGIFTKNAFALDTIISVTYYKESDTKAVENALALCTSYESIFSRTNSDSELYKLNESMHNASEKDIIRTDSEGRDYYGFVISDDLYDILTQCIYYASIEIDGIKAFNFSLGAISGIYAFSDNEHAVPTEEELAELLKHTDTDCFSLEDGMFVTSDTKATLDLGAIAKGYIADKMKEAMLASGVRSAIINLGGNVLLIGSKTNGSDYEVGIADPTEPNKSLASVKASDCSVVTSGAYQRYFEMDGVTYHHLLDPYTGFPVQNGISAVTIVSESSCQADALSTMFFVLGAEKKEKLEELFPDVKFYYIDSNNIFYQ